jgi:cellulose synthase/poly-beta-1,6-N-acetylglucosamine synthase-like glycosyltransferase
MTVLFWIAVGIVFYTFLGYGIVLFVLQKLKSIVSKQKKQPETPDEWPAITLIVAAYNEAYILEEKIANTLSLDYPADKFHCIFVTDGSTDNSSEIIQRHPRIQLMHEAERKGKIAAVDRAIEQAQTDILIFTDANTLLNKQALKNICKHYTNPTTGAVAGEKRVKIEETADATAGEGIYWKYESTLKKWDARLYSAVGAAGELFSIRKSLYEAVAPDTLLDDFMISMRIAMKGYRIAYAPDAYATEAASENTKEEWKRKVRISAGGIQSFVRLWTLLIPYPNPLFSFMYLSHRVLRWTITPYCLLLAFISNAWLVAAGEAHWFYTISLLAQAGFYGLAIIGWWQSTREMKSKIFFVPYYFCFMNAAVVAGLFRYLGKKQSVVWEKARRK